MTLKRRICVITGTRAEYGILFPLLKIFKNHPSVELQLVVTGSHLSPVHGNTYREIEQDGFYISKKIDLKLDLDSNAACVKAAGLAMLGFADAFADLNPEIVVALGDRYEMHSAVTSCALMNIPVCHIAGGEITEGAFDDALRHSISKMASLHFTTHDAYSSRLRQMGAAPNSIIKTGSLAIDNIRNETMLALDQLEGKLSAKLSQPFLMLTFHPETRSQSSPLVALEEILSALDARPDLALIITEPNSDPGSTAIRNRLQSYAKSRGKNVQIFPSLGRKNFLSALKLSKGLVGNSSSGISEAPACGVGTVNIGSRQQGRLMPPSVITVMPIKSEIITALDKIISPGFKSTCDISQSFYGDGTAAGKMAEILSSSDLNSMLSTQFHDVE
jgi:UDP-hydrolysing UDP-N-acetyl-D-glucosamine 2-epimerase